VGTLPDFVEFQFVPAPPLRSLFPMASEDALDLLSKMFTLDPKNRISAQQALEHRFVPFFDVIFSWNEKLMFLVKPLIVCENFEIIVNIRVNPE